MKAQTYNDWRLLGYQVREGEEASGRNAKGEATFTRAQVDDAPVRASGPVKGFADDEDWE